MGFGWVFIFLDAAEGGFFFCFGVSLFCWGFFWFCFLAFSPPPKKTIVGESVNREQIGVMFWNVCAG